MSDVNCRQIHSATDLNFSNRISADSARCNASVQQSTDTCALRDFVHINASVRTISEAFYLASAGKEQDIVVLHIVSFKNISTVSWKQNS